MSLLFFARKAGKGYGAYPHARFAQLGLQYGGKVVADLLSTKYNLKVTKILLRADAHPWTYNTQHSGITKDNFHLTLDVKTKEMEAANQHLTVHAYIRMTSGGTIENMFDIEHVTPKFKKGSTTDLAIEKDSFVDMRRGGKTVNNWDPAELDVHPAAPELKHVVLGKGFITVVEAALVSIPKEKQEKEIKEATAEEIAIRNALAVIPDKL